MSCFHLCRCVVITLPVAQSAPPQTRDTAQPYQREKHGWPGSHEEPNDPWGRCPPFKVLHMCNGDIGGWIWLLFPSMTAPQKEKKKSKNNSSGVKAAVRWQPVQRGARCRHPSVPSVRFSEGQSSAALHVAAVLFTSLWKPITSPRCCASQSCYISHTNTRKRALTQMRRAHAHTHTDKHLQQQLFLAAVEGRNNAFWPVCGEIYRCAHMERLFTAQVHQEAS